MSTYIYAKMATVDVLVTCLGNVWIVTSSGIPEIAHVAVAQSDRKTIWPNVNNGHMILWTVAER